VSYALGPVRTESDRHGSVRIYDFLPARALPIALCFDYLDYRVADPVPNESNLNQFHPQQTEPPRSASASNASHGDGCTRSIEPIFAHVAEVASAMVRVKPRWRGVSHQYGFFAAIIPGLLLVRAAPTARAALAVAIYAGSLLALLGTSAIYHRIDWRPRARYWMGRLDLAMIFVLIAGSYTPIALLALPDPLGAWVLRLAWGAAGAGIVLKLLWTNAPKWANSLVYVSFASTGALLMPALADAVGLGATLLYVAGGVLYIAGAIVYGIQRPDPLPSVFGYHEIFHALVLGAAAFHFAAVALYIVPLAT